MTPRPNTRIASLGREIEAALIVSEWEKTVTQVRAAHHRKAGFMKGLERVVADADPSQEPSFLNRANARWGRHKDGGSK